MAGTVLMALMGLDIGGAETHVVELSRELKRRGWNVAVASNGGVYVSELEAEGIRHYQASLNRNSPFAMLKGLFALRRIIKQVKPDVVHAHARIPAFLCGILRKSMHFPFVTSAHWVFKVTPLLKMLTDWGQKSIAVSDDIKQYLTDNYGMDSADITVTINGIDTDKFSPDTDASRVRSELGLECDTPVVVHVSRLDDSRALVAGQLVEAAADIAAEIPNVKIVIVGDGDAAEEICTHAAEVNTALGREVLVFTGARTDINELVAAGDVFVGVSRAALEAMSAAKPVVIAGNEGYIGIFTSDKLEKARENNFCCRGCEMPTPEKLSRDIIALLRENDKNKLSELGQTGRDVIFSYYSAARMAEDAESVYAQVIPPRRVLMSGYYGYNNLGDEAILRSVCHSVHEIEPTAELTVLSGSPEQTAAEYGVRSVNRFSPFEVMSAVRSCDILISGGGSLLQDKTSTRSLLYYLWLINSAERRRKRVVLFANGIGPVTHELNRRRVKRTVERADVVTLRERESLEELERMGVDTSELLVTADPVFMTESVDSDEALKLLSDAGVPTERPIVGISLRNWEGMGDAETELAGFCDEIASVHGCTPLFIVMQLPNDLAACERVRALMKEQSFEFESPYHPERMMGVIAQMEAVVSMRLHTLVFAAKQRVPFAGIVYDPKVSSFLKLCGMESCGEPSGFDGAYASDCLGRILKNRDELCGKLEKTASEMESRAAVNVDMLKKLI